MGNTQPIISVIIVNCNGVRHLDECLSSLAKQTFRPFETILVDNGSTDGSVQYVTTHFPGTHTVELDRNEGFCRGNLTGLDYAAGQYIALLNNDTAVDPKWLESLYTAMQENPNIGMCASCMVNYFSRDILDTAGDGYDICGVGFKTGEGRPVTEFQDKRAVFGACAGASLYRHSMLDEIGFFDERFFAYGEDLDLSFRAKLAGYVCIFVPEAIVYHKINQTVGTTSDFLLFHTRRNIEYTYFKNMPLPLLLITLPLHLLYNLITFIQAFQQKRSAVYFKAKLEFIKGFSRVWGERASIQDRRKISLLSLLNSFSKDYLLLRLRKNIG